MSGTSAHGQGHATSFAMIVSDRLGIPIGPDQLRAVRHRVVPSGGGTGGSRSLQLGGSAVVRGRPRRARAGGRGSRRGLLEADAGRHRGSPTTGVRRRRRARRPARRWRDLAAPGRRARRLAARRPRRAADGRDVPVRRPRLGGRGRHRDRPGDPAAARRGRRLRPDPEPDDRRRPAARRHRPGHVAGALGAVRVRRRRAAADLDLRRLPDADRGRHDPASRRPTPRPRPTSTSSAPRGSASPARSAPRRPCRAPSSTRCATSGVRHIDIPCTPERVWPAIQEARAGDAPRPLARAAGGVRRSSRRDGEDGPRRVEV